MKNRIFHEINHPASLVYLRKPPYDITVSYDMICDVWILEQKLQPAHDGHGLWIARSLQHQQHDRSLSEYPEMERGRGRVASLVSHEENTTARKILGCLVNLLGHVDMLWLSIFLGIMIIYLTFPDKICQIEALGYRFRGWFDCLLSCCNSGIPGFFRMSGAYFVSREPVDLHMGVMKMSESSQGNL